MMARTVLAIAALLVAHGALAGAPDAHQFGVVGHSFANGSGEAQLRQALAEGVDQADAFVVVTGVKSGVEPCSDKLYEQRRALLDEARRPVIAALAASDWSECRNSAGRSAAIERLNRLRELYFAESASLGTARKLALTRQSSNPKFRSYAENAYWIVGKVLYATVNLPANNNHYRPEAGRNSEFEDRLVANRFWLNRLFALAQRHKLDALVLFSEGDVKALKQAVGLGALLARATDRQDGFAEPRRQIGTLAQKFKGRVLLVDTAPGSAEPAIEWRANLGHLSVGGGAVEVRVTPGTELLFTLKDANR
ncbi:MAG: hypothetical protein V4508_18445 [Pseudomonadota bacterium]